MHSDEREPLPDPAPRTRREQVIGRGGGVSHQRPRYVGLRIGTEGRTLSREEIYSYLDF